MSSQSTNRPTDGPHQAIPAADARERFALELFDRLWERYRRRVSYVQVYEKMVADRGATFFNDHIALRTFAGQAPLTGISTVSRIFEALGYRAAGNYHFEDKKLSAIHFQHANPKFPKIFVSELKVWELDREARDIIGRLLADHPVIADTEMLASLASLTDSGRDDELMSRVESCFERLPWGRPERRDVLKLNEINQYAAWVAVHGYDVNHFTSLINSHQTDALNTIDKTVQALRDLGVPMKKDVEGEPGSKLRQSATEAVVIDVPIVDGSTETTMPWTYAYFELAERGNVVDAEGRATRFEGFLGPQATQLFEMTKVT